MLPSSVDERTFDLLAARTLGALEVELNELEGVEADLESGILTIGFDDGTRYIVNSHRAARQIWMAAQARAWHFNVDPDTERWVASKSDEELWACLSEQVAEKLGRPVGLVPRGASPSSPRLL